MDLDAIHELTQDPEYSSLEEFLEYCQDDERHEYTHIELRALAYNLKTSGTKIRAALMLHGLKLAPRAPVKRTRGFKSNNHDRWAGNPCAGGSGHEQIRGFAGYKG